MSKDKNPMRRGSMFEVFEPRDLMAADLQINTAISTATATGAVYLQATAETRASDVNLDGLINHRDAHSVTRFINDRLAGGDSSEGESAAQSAVSMDTNGDGEVGPRDVLWIVNKINEYDPLTPCDCGACSQPSGARSCQNASLAQAQSSSLTNAITNLPAGEFASPNLDMVLASQAIEELLRIRRM